MRPTFENDKEDTLAIIDKLESVVTNLSIHIEDSEGISEEEYRNIEKYIDETNAAIRELRDKINYSN